MPVGKAPGDLAVDQQSGTVYVSDAGTSTVSVFQDRLEGEPAELPSRLAASPGREAAPGLQPAGHGDRRPRTSEEFRGKKYILNFFASW